MLYIYELQQLLDAPRRRLAKLNPRKGWRPIREQDSDQRSDVKGDGQAGREDSDRRAP